MSNIQELRNLIKDMYDYWREHSKDHYCKPLEGAITINEYYPDYFEDLGKGVMYSIEVYSYIFCNEGRRFEAKDKSREVVIQMAIDYFKERFKEYKEELENKND